MLGFTPLTVFVYEKHQAVIDTLGSNAECLGFQDIHAGGTDNHVVKFQSEGSLDFQIDAAHGLVFRRKLFQCGAYHLFSDVAHGLDAAIKLRKIFAYPKLSASLLVIGPFRKSRNPKANKEFPELLL